MSKKTIKLSDDQKAEIKALIALQVSDNQIKRDYSVSPQQLTALKAVVTKEKNKQLKTKVPAAASEETIPTIPIDIPLSALLESTSEARIVIRLIK